MKKVKYSILFLIILIIAIMIPNLSKAAEKELTYSDTAQGIEWAYLLDESGNITNLRCKTKAAIGKVTIPSTINGKTVISLNGAYWNGSDWLYGAFNGFSGITEVIIPNTIATIGDNAFQNCTGLKSITIPNSVTSIGDSAFSGCSGLTSVTFSNKLSSIGASAFQNCTGLKSITIPNTVTSIGNSAFKKCTGLQNITLSNNLSKIDSGTFIGCSGLTSIKLPESVTTISDDGWNYQGAFYGCTGLTKILIPDSVATIDENVFRDCKKLIIYGHDGQVSKTYAQENKIKFDYIENWDKPITSTGTDITAPTVKSIEVKNSTIAGFWNSNSSMYYVPTGKVLIINANFSENIEGTTVPILTIKFGSGKNIALTNGTIAGATISYTYTIQSTDKGTMQTVSFSGGNIKDATGNVAKLSCPSLNTELYNRIVYANGSAANVNGSGSTTGTANTNSSTSTTTTSSTNKPSTSTTSKPSTSTATSKPTLNINTNKPATTTSSNSSTTKKDDTTASGKMPQTGIATFGITATIIVTIAIGVITLKKYRNLRDI